MFKLFQVFILLFSFAVAPLNGALAYQEAQLGQVMGELKSANPVLFKKAIKVYEYASKNTNEIIDKPLLVKHNKAMNGFVDRNNKVAAKFFASGTEGIGARMVMLFKIGGKKYKVIEDYIRAEKCKKWSACASWKKVN